MGNENDPTEDVVIDRLDSYAHEHPFLEEMDFSLEGYEDGFLRATVPYLEQFASPPDETCKLPAGAQPLHGGIVCSLLDTVMGFAVMGECVGSDRRNGPTVGLDIDFISAANGPLDLFAPPVRIGASVASVRGGVYHQGTEDVVAIGQGVWRVY